MKVVFIGNYYNHHQASLSHALYQQLEGQYAFIQTEKISEQRIALGYAQHVEEPFLFSYQSDKLVCDALIQEADAVIFGTAPKALLKPTIKAGKLIFRYSERPLKDGMEWYKYLPRLIKWHMYYPASKPIYLLAAGAYTVRDYRKFGLFRNKAYQWGYFPETKIYGDMDALLAQKDRTSLLWCGRFIDWKHPDDAVKVAARLKREGYHFSLNFIGCGEMESSLRRAISTEGLGDQVHILGSMSPAEVRRHMENTGIFLMTSDAKEGWGVVLNEAMNSGCATVASHAAGSTPMLLRHRENGLIYPSKNTDLLYEQVKYLLNHPHEQTRLGKAAYDTIVHRWSADMAAQRLLSLAERIRQGERYPDLYESGPCSRAEIISDQWRDDGV